MTRLTLLLVCAGAALTARASTIYSTGFEHPTFNTGQLVGQDDWVTDHTNSAARVQTSVVHSGYQAVKIDALPIVLDHWWWSAGHAYDPWGAGESVVQVETYMRLSSDYFRSESWGLDVYDSQVDRVGLWSVDDDNNLRVWNGTSGLDVDTGVDIARGQWYRFTARFDYRAGTYTVLVDGVQAGGTYPMGSTLDFGDADFRVTEPGFDKAYFDDFSVTTQPEPASLGLVLLAGVAGLRRRA